MKDGFGLFEIQDIAEPSLEIEQLSVYCEAPAINATQGIKFREDDKPKDRFGQQLKSFTEWLKTLKKTPETETAVAASGPEDKKVTQLAEHSLVEKEVVTEAMADVWEKQGNHSKAIDTYRKLSLLNPSKSAYFAAKIDHLKQL